MLWDAAQYLRFGEERTQVSRDLIARVARRLQPKSIVDLGCGPGNSTAVLHEQWPNASLFGLDASAEMLRAARSAYPGLDFQQGDISAWAAAAAPVAELIFANSALQWVEDWPRVLPLVLQRVRPGGAFAFQVPANQHAPAVQIVRDMAAGEWRARMCAGVAPFACEQNRREEAAKFRRAARPRIFPRRDPGRLGHSGVPGRPRVSGSPRFPGRGPAPVNRGAELQQWHTETLDFFYDTLAPHASEISLWETTYVQIVPGVEGIAEWYKGSGLRPYLQALPSDAERDRFLHEYHDRLRAAYPTRPDGQVLFPFLRRFVIAWART